MTAFEIVESQVGRQAASLWDTLNTLEATKRSGKEGEIIFDLPYLTCVTGWTENDIIEASRRLLCNGLARPVNNGQALKAA